MRTFSLKDIIKQKKSKISKEQVQEKLASSPYNQILHRWNTDPENKQGLLYIYDWQSFVNPPLTQIDDDTKVLSSIKIKDKKRQKKKEQKAIAFNSIQEDETKLKIGGKKPKVENKKVKGSKKKPKISKSKDKPKKLNLAVVEFAAPAHWNLLSNVTVKPADSFTQWINNIDPRYATDQIDSGKKAKKSKKKKSKKSNPIKTKIDASVQSKDQIVSEHLAKLYMDQGYYTQALDMYERLSLNNPEKSHFFAPLIEELKRKI
ncbi:MAG: hypothetical protein HKN09_06520 [Saprospiraceae bacterium]|nr:hypothetical protein [Saprospiraceae bacterium]